MLFFIIDRSEKDMYLFISSGDSMMYHPENKPHTFIVEFGERINLTGRWSVALSDLNLNVTTTEICFSFVISVTSHTSGIP